MDWDAHGAGVPGVAVVTARQYAIAGVAIGAFGLAYATSHAHPVTVAFCGVLWGWTVALAVLTWRGTSR